MNLNVTLTLSDRLFVLLEDKLPNLGKRFRRALDKEVGAQIRGESSISISVSPETPSAETPAPAVTVETPQPEDREPTPADCRAALARCRDRFEGDDKDNKESERYGRYHKAISSLCRQIVMEVSAGSAEKIPDLKGEQRAAFINAMDALILDDCGNIVTPPAPY